MEVRSAIEQDIPAICRLNREALGYDCTEDSVRRWVMPLIKKAGHRILVAEMDGNVVGYAHAADYDSIYSEPMKVIVSIAIDVQKHGMGIGRNLLSVVEQWAREEGVAGVRLYSGADRVSAHEFYLACEYHHHKDAKSFVKYF